MTSCKSLMVVGSLIPPKSRLNAMIDRFCNATTDGVFQKDFCWFIRDNNVTRDFDNGYIFASFRSNLTFMSERSANFFTVKPSANVLMNIVIGLLIYNNNDASFFHLRSTQQ